MVQPGDLARTVSLGIREGVPSFSDNHNVVEALAVLVALKVFYGEDAGQRRKKALVMPTWTDNRGNGAALNRLMTTRYPRERRAHGVGFTHESYGTEGPGGVDSPLRQQRG